VEIWKKVIVFFFVKQIKSYPTEFRTPTAKTNRMEERYTTVRCIAGSSRKAGAAGESLKSPMTL
jgi:hypothetical protein